MRICHREGPWGTFLLHLCCVIRFGSMQSEIDYSAIAVLDKIGDGAFGEVYKGRLWGTDVGLMLPRHGIS
jgi:hypothetical protein